MASYYICNPDYFSDPTSKTYLKNCLSGLSICQEYHPQNPPISPSFDIKNFCYNT